MVSMPWTTAASRAPHAEYEAPPWAAATSVGTEPWRQSKTPEHRRRRGGRVHRNPRRVKPMRASTGGWDRRIDAVEHTEREERRRLVASTITETAGFRRNRPAKAAAAEKEKAREREAR